MFGEILCKKLLLLLISILITLNFCHSEQILEPAENKHTSHLYPVSVDGKLGYIDKTGKIIIEPQFDEAYVFSNGLAKIKVGDKYGFIDKTSKVVINPLSDTSSYFNEEGIADITTYSKDHQKQDFRGYINTKGEYIWKPSR